MNCPSRTDDPPEDAGWNQNPPSLAADLTTREDLNGIVNSRSRRSFKSIRLEEHGQVPIAVDPLQDADEASNNERPTSAGTRQENIRRPANSNDRSDDPSPALHNSDLGSEARRRVLDRGKTVKVWHMILKFGKFIGPGFMVAVAYIDPGNYSTDVAAGASKKFALLFIVLMSNVFAIVLQSLAIRLGTVTGLNLAEHCRAHLPRWLNIALYIMGEGAIIATDIAEVGR